MIHPSLRHCRGARALGVAGLAGALLAGCAAERTPPAPVCTGTETPASRLFLQQVSATGAIVRWHGACNTPARCALFRVRFRRRRPRPIPPTTPWPRARASAAT